MDKTYLDELINALQVDERLVNSEGKLLKTKITEHAQNLDTELIKLLLTNKKLKGFFFKEIDGVCVFNQEKFLTFVHNEAFLADSFTAFKNKIGLATSRDNYLIERNEVVLNWPYKDCVLEGGQDKEDQKRDEVFWNETLGADQRDVLLAPKVLTGFKKYDKDGEHEVTKISEKDNFIIRGNNLLALHTLKKRYAGKVKLIYIDPPYNTGNDGFNYNDRFNHSTWLVFMKNRLEVAKDLLSDSGVIYVQCDDNEQAYLKVLMDEVFGRHNHLNTIIWSYEGTQSPSNVKLASKHDTIFRYGKNINKVQLVKAYYDQEINPKTYSSFFEDARGAYRIQGLGDYSKESIAKFEKEGRIYHSSKGTTYLKHYFKVVNGRYFKPKKLSDVWDDVTQLGTSVQKEKTGFTSQKPEKLLKRIIETDTQDGEIVLDYHLGSGTTSVVAHKMRRQYLGIEQLDYGDNDATARLQNIIKGDQAGISQAVEWQGGGSFVYVHLKNDVNVFIKEVEKAKDKKEVEDLLQTVLASNFLSYRVNPVKFEKDEFAKLPLVQQKSLLIDLVNKNKLYVNYHDIDDVSYKIDANTKKLNKWLQSRD